MTPADLTPADLIALAGMSANERKTEARVLRRVAEALRNAYTPGYYGMGGPQDDDDDEPPSFNAGSAATELEQTAAVLDPPASRPGC